MGANTASKSIVKSRSVRKVKLEVYEMKEYSTQANTDMILADVLKGEINRTPEGSQ